MESKKKDDRKFNFINAVNDLEEEDSTLGNEYGLGIKTGRMQIDLPPSNWTYLK